MDFRIALESYLELGPNDDYPAPCTEARMIKNLCIYPDHPGEYDEPIYKVTIKTIEDLMAIVSETNCPIEFDGNTITIKDRYY